MRYVLAILVALAAASPAFAEEYEKGPNGGLMLDVAGIDVELQTSGNTVTINVFEAFKPKPVSTKGYTAAVLIVSGANRETLTLTQSGENSLKGEAKKPIPPDATITLTIKTAEGKSGQVKFRK
ncbi:MAG TPA: hypothetical protein VNY08_09780 [Bradyrhizobium sp.]|jgi:hypothetical protein|nr:hypothetical protein [Bradyrhizobium sp.]